MSARKVDNEISDFLQFHRLGKKPKITFDLLDPNGLFEGHVDVSKMIPRLTDKDLQELKAQVDEEERKRKGANVTAS